ncbi:hypothetical protein PFICI_08878 [Pestalotiopsis fici W106-1]|uniref:AttH domain-containing protein n=1 Tax=Pestalotiopsis fici (strain W106-1 / CGMCC3.15140) TaxID=1229662 RepID=W3WYU2_PESFW|nr:uncharacterized protein PFICI_08878 [Pestalotiopsis fici W106-1]ETS79025.1 hypothetical protein PFICI_08878 [Pestalotiopsis fici W106-1]
MTLKGGTTLYCDVFVPNELHDLSVKPQKQMPAIVAWTPYGKQNSKPNIDDFPFRAGVSADDLSGLETSAKAILLCTMNRRSHRATERHLASGKAFATPQDWEKPFTSVESTNCRLQDHLAITKRSFLEFTSKSNWVGCYSPKYAIARRRFLMLIPQYPNMILTMAHALNQRDDSYVNPNIPALINQTISQYDVSTGSSYWASSFVTSDEGQKFLAISHILTTEAPDPVCRSSVLDLQTNEYWVDLTYCHAANENAFDTSIPLDLDYGTYGFRSTSADSISEMSTFAETNASFAFNISWKATSQTLLNGGSGIIAFGAGPANATEWGLPACQSSGTLTLNGTTHVIDADNSFTWFDRQVSFGAPKNWTWFELNFPGSAIKASVWAYDLGVTGQSPYQFATVRVGHSMQVLAYTWTPNMKNTWVSPKSGLVYPLEWTLDFENGDYLDVQSIRPDQEMYGSNALVDSAYEGFITVRGRFQGQESGFGVVEMVTAYQ